MFATDILSSVEGPGRMDFFRYNPDATPPLTCTVCRKLDRLALLNASTRGSHPQHHDLHPPGRYVVTYRTVARSTDGRIIGLQAVSWSGRLAACSPCSVTPHRRTTVDRQCGARR